MKSLLCSQDFQRLVNGFESRQHEKILYSASQSGFQSSSYRRDRGFKADSEEYCRPSAVVESNVNRING